MHYRSSDVNLFAGVKAVGIAAVVFLIALSGLTADSLPDPSNQPGGPDKKSEPHRKSKANPALLRIETTPTNASIIINKKREPLQTPAEFYLLPGDYEVALALDCYTPASTTLHLAAGETRTLSRDLQKLPTALSIRSAPSGAMIYIDGAPSNQRTPSTISGVAVGDHSVQVELPGYHSQSMAVSAKCGETLIVDFGALRRLTATITITSRPPGASLWTNGCNSGLTTPCSIELPPGEHALRFSGIRGYLPMDRKLSIQDEETFRLDVRLLPESPVAPTNDVSPQSQLHTGPAYSSCSPGARSGHSLLLPARFRAGLFSLPIWGKTIITKRTSL